MTHPELREAVEKPITLYCGFDPTADALHLGNFVALMGLKFFQQFGHKPVVLIGGATGLIGDPSGKSSERPFLTLETVEKNICGIRKSLDAIFGIGEYELVNNADWVRGLSVIDFLREVGKEFRLGVMLSRETVKMRIETGEGMSFTEFSYPLFQAYDFYHLFSEKGVVLQTGGSDQYGNILAGVEFIRKKSGKSAFGLTLPLLVRSDGKKFGKSESGAVWLDADKTSPYEMYQYLYNIPDADTAQMMRMLTLFDNKEIDQWEKKLSSGTFVPGQAQKRLAEEVVRSIHGAAGLTSAQSATSTLMTGSLNPDALEEHAKTLPSVRFERSAVVGASFIELGVLSGLFSSKGEGRKIVQGGGASLNNVKVDDIKKIIDTADLIRNRFVILGLGKKKKIVIVVH